MSLFEKLKNNVAKVGSATDAVRTAREAFSAFSNTQHPYNGMMGNPTTSRGKEGRLEYYQKPELEIEDEDFEPQIVEREVSAALMESFRKRAAMKTDMIILELQKKYLFQKVLAKIIIQNKGDDLIAKKHEDLDDDEIKELPKEVQKVLRNQKHLKAIEGFKIEDYFKESCIEYFTMEFEEDYRNGLTPDFKDINPIELLTMKMQEPFQKLVADYVVDYVLEVKPKIIEGASTLKTKYIDGAIKKVTNDSQKPAISLEADKNVTKQDELQVEASKESDEPSEDEQQDINDKWAESVSKFNKNVEETTETEVNLITQ